MAGVIHVCFHLGRLPSKETAGCLVELPAWLELAACSDVSKAASGTGDEVGAETGSRLDRSTGLTFRERMDALRNRVAASSDS